MKYFVPEIYLLAVIMIVVSGLSSCEKSTVEPIFLGHEYFGHTLGRWIVYDVDSTVYDDFLGQVFHYQYQVKEVNANFFIDSQGDSVMRIERFYRLQETDPWQKKNVWTSKLLSSQAIKTEENITYLKLVFPAKRNQKWNGNVFNTLPTQNYTITQAHTFAEYGNMVFDSTLLVMQKNFETLISLDLQYEVYAFGVGLAEKKFVELSKEIDGSIVRGVAYTYVINAYGYR